MTAYGKVPSMPFRIQFVFKAYLRESTCPFSLLHRTLYPIKVSVPCTTRDLCSTTDAPSWPCTDTSRSNGA